MNVHTDSTTLISFSQLALSPKNVRTGAPKNIDALAASIAVQGVLQNLVVSPVDAGMYHVHAGGRRFLAIAKLVQDGKRTPDFRVPCKIVPEGNATAASLAENTMREAMHPADEFDAFVKLVDQEGFTIDFVADAFGVTPLVVERRLKLTKAAPELLQAFRRDEISTDQLMALCTTDDHELQCRVWKNANTGWNRAAETAPKALRRAVTQREIDVSTDKRIPFIGGLQVYRDAGGTVRTDLFTGDGSGGFITDAVLLDELVRAKIDADAERYAAAGWGWVEVRTDLDETEIRRMGRLSAELMTLPEEVAAKVKALNGEIETLQERVDAVWNDENDDMTDADREEAREAEERIGEAEDEIAELTNMHGDYPPEVRATAGVVLAFADGQLEIIKGLVRTADRAKAAQAAGDAGAVRGGRETTPAGRKDGAELSDALRRSLLGHRNLAAQIETAKRPDVAKVMLACWTVQRIREDGMGRGYSGLGVPSDLYISSMDRGGTRVGHKIVDAAGEAKTEAFSDACDAVVVGLPDDEGKLWDALAAMASAELDALIAYGVALSVSLAPENDHLTGKLIAALGLDMSQHFEPTADNYLGKVSKPLIVEALKEAEKVDGPSDADALQAMKKGSLVAEAEARLAGSGWVPKLIRTPKPKAPAPAKPAKPAKKAPATKPAAKKTTKPAAKTPAAKKSAKKA